MKDIVIRTTRRENLMENLSTAAKFQFQFQREDKKTTTINHYRHFFDQEPFFIINMPMGDKSLLRFEIKSKS